FVRPKIRALVRKEDVTENLWKKCSTCWGEIAQYQCTKGKKTEVLDTAFAEAKKAGKLVLYIGNTGG
ncbi:MAG: hypothetical protein IH987_22360, partial [Planctomycetes bacterium]|nr:hypothetical protein [Planctomycetota bacterium]